MSTDSSTNDAAGLGSGTLGLIGSNASPNDALGPNDNATATYSDYEEETDEEEDEEEDEEQQFYRFGEDEGQQFYRFRIANFKYPTSEVLARMKAEDAPLGMQAGVLSGKVVFLGLEEVEENIAFLSDIAREMRAKQTTELKAELASTKGELKKSKAMFDIQLGDLTTKNQRLKGELEMAEMKRDDWETESQLTAASLEDLQVKYNQQTEELDAANKRADKDKKTIDNLEARVKSTQKELTIAENNISEATEGIQAARQTLEVERKNHGAELKSVQEAAAAEVESYRAAAADELEAAAKNLRNKIKEKENEEDNKKD